MCEWGVLLIERGGTGIDLRERHCEERMWEGIVSSSFIRHPFLTNLGYSLVPLFSLNPFFLVADFSPQTFLSLSVSVSLYWLFLLTCSALFRTKHSSFFVSLAQNCEPLFTFGFQMSCHLLILTAPHISLPRRRKFSTKNFLNTQWFKTTILHIRVDNQFVLLNY